MLDKFRDHIQQYFPFLTDKKLLIAISGGVDSVVLTELLHKLRFNISLAHCNFKLRDKESDIDESFVKEFASNLNIDVFTTQFNTIKISKEHKESTQITARNLRYAWFQKLIKENKFDYILTAHHADDNLETFLINLTRGTGLEGLTGIPALNKNIARPLLAFSRTEILNYTQKNNIVWREDKSNASTKYIRNKIRHQILPILKEINPSLLDSFAKTTQFLQESEQIIKDRITAISPEIIETVTLSSSDKIIKINIEKVLQLSNPKAYLYQFLKAYHFTAWNDVFHLLTAQSGKQLFSKTHRLLKDREFLLLSEIKSIDNQQYFITKDTAEINAPIHLKIKEISEKTINNKQIIYIDKDLLKFPLIVRKWEKGDYFCPLGMRGKKKLSKYFSDEKLSLIEKENTWVLCSSENEIVWVINKRQDSRFVAKQTTTAILKISHI